MPATYESLQPYRDILNRALESPTGLRIRVESRSRMISLRHRLYLTRKMDRDQARKTYEPADERYGWSPYDPLIFIAETETTDEGKRLCSLIIRKVSGQIPGVLSIEEEE